VERYAVGDGVGDDADAGKAFVSLNWLLSEEPLDLETELAWGFLDYLLLGTSAAPLRKALNDSGLGEALIGVFLTLLASSHSASTCCHYPALAHPYLSCTVGP
jgi:Zn-dependent M16 (insulinase) family peptidase